MSAEVDQNASGIGNKQVGRRSIAKGVAWSLPVLAVGAAVPAFAASPSDEDVVISASCTPLVTIGSLPSFTITAIGAPILKNSTFIATSAALALVKVGGVGSTIDVTALGGGRARIKLRNTIPAGGSVTLNITGVISAFVLTTFTLAVETILGNANSNNSNDSASESLLGAGVDVLGVRLFVGFCGGSQPPAAVGKKNSAPTTAQSSKSATPTPSATSSAPASAAPSTPQPSQTQAPVATSSTTAAATTP